VAYLLSKY